jgi:peptidoglycan/xylan/chitin deacetylase (PgdA/CDA1 family)
MYSTRLYRLLYPSLTWRIQTEEKIIYLTFDDGPIPVVTEWVLETLSKFNAKATFFCIGDNIKKHPDIFEKLKQSGHTIGNHTMNHLNGWKTENKTYFDNVNECNRYITTRIFRPPYGRIKSKQIMELKKQFNIIMWDVLSKDYDTCLTGEQCFNRVRSQSRAGSIIVFHDSLKAESRLRYALPATLEYFSQRGFKFGTIPF